MTVPITSIMGFGGGNGIFSKMMTANSPGSRLAMMQQIRGRRRPMNMRQSQRFIKRSKGVPMTRNAAGVPGITAKAARRKKGAVVARLIRNLVYAYSGKPYKAQTMQVKAVANSIMRKAMTREQAKQFPLIVNQDLEVLAKASRG